MIIFNADLKFKDFVKVDLSNDMVDKWRHYGVHPSDPFIKKAISKVIDEKNDPEKYYEIVAPYKDVIDLLSKKIEEYNSKINNEELERIKQSYIVQRSQFTTLKNEESKHARWKQLFNAILFCQILNYARKHNLSSVKLTIELYNQLMSPSVLTELVNKKLLVQNIKEYIDSTTVIYDRSIQLVAVRTLLMAIDGNYLLFE